MRRPPDPLWVSGTLPHPSLPTIAIVGTRRLTPYGARAARELAAAFASAGAVVVSGLAQGIDSTAHAAAIAARGRTIAVLGEGLRAIRECGPVRRKQLAIAISENGALVSEYPMDVRPSDWTFPQRNRTIAGLSDAVIVVEAPAGSGSLITARRAIELRRPLFAVPGPIGAPTWVGSNRLIADGKASLLSDAGEVAQLLGLRLLAPSLVSDLTALGERLMGILAVGASDTDSIADALGVPVSDATTLIAELLIAGQVIATGDGRFARA